MLDSSDAIADWPVLNALLNASSGATWVSVHHGGGVGIGYSLHAGMVIVADGTPDADEKLERVLTCDPGIGVARHADAGYPEAIATARERTGLRIPMREGRSMLTPRTFRTLTRRIVAGRSLTARRIGPRIPVLLGGCGTGKTTAVQQLRDRNPRGSTQFIDVERSATTPERFFRAVAGASPFPGLQRCERTSAAPRAARLRMRRRSSSSTAARRTRSGGEPATFLLDEFLELRTFESFPGLRRVVHDCLDGLAASGNRFVLTSRYTARALRLLRDRTARFEVLHVPALTAEDTLDMLGLAAARDTQDADYLARTVQALADGRPSYVRAIADELAPMREHGGPETANDPISALASLMAPGAGSPSTATSATSCACIGPAATAP